MIDWKRHFDRIWCVSYTGYPERRDQMQEELARVGILDSGIFHWRYTVPTIFNDILFDVTKKRNLNNCRTKAALSGALGHYACMKASLGLGDRRILIVEDDIRFRNDLLFVEHAMSDLPNDFDVVLFDYFARYTGNDRADRVAYDRMVEGRVNDTYSRFDHLWSAGCYGLSAKAMTFITENMERMFDVIDVMTSRAMDNSGMNRYFCVDQIACQKEFSVSNNGGLGDGSAQEKAYRFIGLDMSKFNL